ncbi:hypothetical protein [Nocardioides bruguierae]|uniref:hypothetical protein n=1 Tax=Nocardioides bruguierae TaxID=2945102 RepID=UPI002021D0F3|nr:hypothetical protein [Nocardioides bruguierae]MCL8026062.1 hypothetical protein [Nocardioides bruguierae]
MARRVSMPTADDLFRPTADGEAQRGEPGEQGVDEAGSPAPAAPVPSAPTPAASAPVAEPPAGKPSGRVRHDEKMTVYLSSDELLRIEQARLALRGTPGARVDRGRLVREALALVLADFEEQGEDSALVRRLRQE